MIDKKKLKEDYKNIVDQKGIYIFRNKETGKVLLGSTLNLKNKDVKTKLMLKTGNYFNSEFQSDWNKFGENGFEYEILETLELKDDPQYNYKDDLELLEMIWIEKYSPLSEKTYNKNEKIRTV